MHKNRINCLFVFCNILIVIMKVIVVCNVPIMWFFLHMCCIYFRHILWNWFYYNYIENAHIEIKMWLICWLMKYTLHASCLFLKRLPMGSYDFNHDVHIVEQYYHTCWPRWYIPRCSPTTVTQYIKTTLSIQCRARHEKIYSLLNRIRSPTSCKGEACEASHSFVPDSAPN